MARRGICVCADRNSICDLDDKQNQTLIPWCFPHTGAKNIAHKLLVHAAEEDEKDEEPVTNSMTSKPRKKRLSRVKMMMLTPPSCLPTPYCHMTLIQQETRALSQMTFLMTQLIMLTRGVE